MRGRTAGDWVVSMVGVGFEIYGSLGSVLGLLSFVR
jgi:uncharacterized BrkB/YihY/UPF0761 family membrane protein